MATLDFVKRNNRKTRAALLFFIISGTNLISLQAEKYALSEYCIANYGFYLKKSNFPS